MFYLLKHNFSIHHYEQRFYLTLPNCFDKLVDIFNCVNLVGSFQHNVTVKPLALVNSILKQIEVT